MATRLSKMGIEDGLAAKVPPHNLEAEESVLGACLLSREAVANVLEIVIPEHFYKPAHTEIFSAMLELYGRGDPIDAVTLAEELRRRGTLESTGGKPYIFTLVQTVPTAGSAIHYARIVEENSLLRRLIEAAHSISDLAYSVPEDVENAVDFAEDLVYRVSQRRDAQDFSALRDLLTENMELVEKLYEQGSTITGLPTGFTELDNITAGLQSSNLIIIAARPAMGKSALAVSIAQHVAVDRHAPVVVFSLEMSKMELVQRLMCAEARVDSNRLRRGRLQESDWPKLSHALGRLAEAPIFIDDTANLTIMEIRAKCRRLKAKHGLALIIVDYLQLMLPGPGRRSDNRVAEVTEISRSLKILARELDVPVIAVSQLSRNVEHRTDKRPMLADLRESGCLTADTRILRSDTGASVTMGELYAAQERNIPIWTMNDDLKMVPGKMTHVFSSGVKSVFRVKLRSGREIKASGNHPFFTLDGWRALDELKVGERLATPRLLPCPEKPKKGARGLKTEELLNFLLSLKGNPNLDTVPHGVWRLVKESLAERGMSHRAYAQAMGTAYGGSSITSGSVGRARLTAVAELLDDASLSDLAKSDLFWDEIRSIELIGEQPVFDATVPGTNNFVANGIVTHNSIEQDADIVMFIYRDEVYNLDSPQKGIAEVQVAKHRNGPIGKVELAFLDHYTKFANLARGL